MLSHFARPPGCKTTAIPTPHATRGVWTVYSDQDDGWTTISITHGPTGRALLQADAVHENEPDAPARIAQQSQHLIEIAEALFVAHPTAGEHMQPGQSPTQNTPEFAELKQASFKAILLRIEQLQAAERP